MEKVIETGQEITVKNAEGGKIDAGNFSVSEQIVFIYRSPIGLLVGFSYKF